MEWLDALILGIVQGLSEYLPVSSSGHLEIFREILGIDLPGSEILQFDVAVHAATVCSTIVVLWPLFSGLCRSFFCWKRNAGFYYVWKLLFSCIPVAIVGFCFKPLVESFFGAGLTIVGICLIITAVLLAFAHFSGVRTARGEVGRTDGRNITWLDAFVIGCAQAVAVLPGLSRSGTTIATGILLGDKRDRVASFSFLMVIVPILGEMALHIKDMIETPASEAAVSPLCICVGFASAFIVGCAACRWMLNLVKRGKLIWFSVYCVIMGVVCLLWR